ncbi:MAG: ABC transporter transmembrane domain-containing protein [Rhodospirillales bacterium]|jgi:ABC-type multidrug transport system fused ATPase/permease subunit|nr:ABC transporter transmembrane domain-containing protein [Rhodospirillales bacterium]
MEPTLFKYIFKYSWQQQLQLLVITLLSFPFLYYSLELPKLIINQAIGGKTFPKSIAGFEFDQLDYLAFLCAGFLLLVAINGGFKYVINVYKGIVGERMLRRLRYQMFCRTLRFPVPHFRRASQGELIAMMTAEVETLGNFIGDAVAQPMFQGGTLLTILTFMFVQDWALGLAAISLYPFQIYFIPKLQRQVNQLSKERVKAVRRLSERIGETVTTIEEIHANSTSEYHRAGFSHWAGTILDIRFRIYKKKFFIKFLNNFLAQVTPFFFYSIGGYLVIKGNLTFGALVAVLAAYKDLSSPWKELLDWYQQKEDARIKYEQVVEQFHPPAMLDEALLLAPAGEVPRLHGRLIARNLTYEDESGIRLVDGVSVSFGIDEAVAIAAPSGAGADILAMLFARLLQPSSGSIHIGADNLATLPETVTGQRIAYVGASTPLMLGTIADNLFYPLKRQPRQPPERDDEARARHGRYEREAALAGNTASDLAADWIDYAAAAARDRASLTERVIGVLDTVELESDVFQYGLRGTLDPAREPGLAQRIREARTLLRARLGEPAYRGLVEPFDPHRYNSNMSVAENILFGLPIGHTFDLEHIGQNSYMRAVLEECGLSRVFLAWGLQVARLMVDLFSGVEAGDPLFERFSFISAEALPEYQAATRRADATSLDGISAEDRNLLTSLPFQLVPARHRLGILTDDNLEKLLSARRMFAANLPPALQGTIAFFQEEHYNAVASVQDNILFGKLVYGRPQSQRAIGALISEVVDAAGLRREIIEIGLGFEVGIGGQRLPTVQRQKLAIARAILKQPDIVIFNGALASIEATTQARILDRLRHGEPRIGVINVQAPPDERRLFDHVILMEAGRVSEVVAMRQAHAAPLVPAPDGEQAR